MPDAAKSKSKTVAGVDLSDVVLLPFGLNWGASSQISNGAKPMNPGLNVDDFDSGVYLVKNDGGGSIAYNNSVFMVKQTNAGSTVVSVQAEPSLADKIKAARIKLDKARLEMGIPTSTERRAKLHSSLSNLKETAVRISNIWPKVQPK